MTRESTLHIRFHGELNDHLAPARREREFDLAVPGSPAVKDVIELVGVPHVEVDTIVSGGQSVGFGHRVGSGDAIQVYPVGCQLELDRIERLQAQPGLPAALRFVLDGHLGRLAAYLRMLGFDTRYDRHAADEDLAATSAGEDRILLSRDRGLLKRSVVRRGYFVRADLPREQLREVTDRFALLDAAAPFSRCMRCNRPLEPVDRDEARRRVPPRVAREQSQFLRCDACDALYWPGSHHARMSRLIEALGGRPSGGRLVAGR